MPPPLFHCLAPEPQYGNAACQGWCGVRHEATPSQSIPSPRWRVAGELPVLGRGRERESQQPHTAILARLAAHPEKLPGTSQQLRRSGASLESASQPCSHKLHFSAPLGLVEGSFHHCAAGDLHSAGAKCRAGTGWLFQLSLPAAGLAGTGGGCFPSTHVRSKQRKKEKNPIPEF